MNSDKSDKAANRSGLPWLVPLLVILIGAFVLARRGFFDSDGSGKSSPAVGRPAPELSLVELSPAMSTVDVSSADVVLLHFWGTWCPPCRLEYPELVEMAAQFEDDPAFRFLPVSCPNGQETVESLQQQTTRYFQRQSIDSPAFADPRGITRRSVAERLAQNTFYFPTSILIDPDGRIAGVWEGYAPGTVAEIESAIRRLLNR